MDRRKGSSKHGPIIVLPKNKNGENILTIMMVREVIY